MRNEGLRTNEFIGNSAFRDWVYYPGEESNAFWAEFLSSHPEKEEEVAEARIFLTGMKLNIEHGFATQDDQEDTYFRIKEKLGREDMTNRRLLSWISWAAAACVLIGMGWWYSGKTSQMGVASYEQNLKLVSDPLAETWNQTDSIMLIKLDDGSSVYLKPGSRISYTRKFNEGKLRKVFLSGEAFFDVVKNPAKPFLVYANELVTKVLGTSFNVRAFDGDENVVVQVRTGKVAVSVASQVRESKNMTSREADGILLLPNQQAVLSRAEIRLVKALVENPVVLEEELVAPDQHAFQFQAAPASEVFGALEKAYGIDIQYDAALFEKCQFSADLTDETLYEKLDVICKSLEATYQILDAQIIISGKGCNY